ncbi:MAG: HlyD family secretion protein [Rhodospirillaceae bacterium]|jgi:membrane fusion protein (multidrug efflux system)
MPRSETPGSREQEPAATEPVEIQRRRPPATLIGLVIVLVLGAVFGYREFDKRLNFLHEEDARIQADMVTISSRVAGWVANVPAGEGMMVGTSTTLVAIDAREARIVLDEMRAQLDAVGAEKVRLKAEQELVRQQTDSHLLSVRSELDAAKVTVSSLNPQLDLTRRDLERNRQLFEQKVASRRQLDQSETQLQRIEREHRIARANLERAEAKVKEAEAERARLAVLAGALAVLTKREAEIGAKIRRQQLDLEDRTIKSPIEGVVDRAFVEAGEYVTPGQRLMLVHDPSRIWIEANVKETHVRRLKVGQDVSVEIDAYPDETFKGRVERIGSTATSAFALLPSPNPSGNFTKITQRLPVRIAIDQREGRLRPGMMVEVNIATSQ